MGNTCTISDTYINTYVYNLYFVSLYVSVLCVSVAAGLGSSSSSHWDLLGNAIITPEYVRLTPDLQSRQGGVWSRIVSVLPTYVSLSPF